MPARMSELRQSAVIVLIASRNIPEALKLIDDTEPGELWERAVTCCLKALCDARAITPAFDAYRCLDLPKEHVLFNTRLGLAVIDAATRKNHPIPDHHAAMLTEHVLDIGDGYAAQEILRHEVTRGQITPAEEHLLNKIVHNAGVGLGAISSPLLDTLMRAVETAETCLVQALEATASC
ncbi:hypothetical protein AB0C81_03095 [Streptomyces roseoverticillatus]|uniref:hypothetical protein n=1 Tax=Streptomyces roseoverticillatus TaxID=66429 RepID=UPI0033EF8DBA